MAQWFRDFDPRQVQRVGRQAQNAGPVARDTGRPREWAPSPLGVRPVAKLEIVSLVLAVLTSHGQCRRRLVARHLIFGLNSIVQKF